MIGRSTKPAVTDLGGCRAHKKIKQTHSSTLNKTTHRAAITTPPRPPRHDPYFTGRDTPLGNPIVNLNLCYNLDLETTMVRDFMGRLRLIHMQARVPPTMLVAAALCFNRRGRLDALKIYFECTLLRQSWSSMVMRDAPSSRVTELFGCALFGRVHRGDTTAGEVSFFCEPCVVPAARRCTPPTRYSVRFPANSYTPHTVRRLQANR